MNVIQPSSTLVPLYKTRLAHARANLEYWAVEYASHGDSVAEDAWFAARKTVSDVWHKLDALKQPGSVSLTHPKPL